MITNEKGFSKKLRKQLLSFGIETVIAEDISKGFPDLLAIDTVKNQTYFFELKFSQSMNSDTHRKLLDPMQLHWLGKLPSSFLLVFVPGKDLFVYQKCNLTVAERLLKYNDACIRFQEVTNIKDLVELLRG